MTTVTINDRYPGPIPAGTAIELVGPGHNFLNVEVRVSGMRRTLFLSPHWLDGLPTDAPQPECAAATDHEALESHDPPRCPCCGQVLP